MLTLSLTQLPRLLEIENNTQERLTEAQISGGCACDLQ